MADPILISSGIVDVVFGENVKVVTPVNLYGCTVGSNTFIGPFVEIQKDVTIGEHCKIQSHSFICELVTIGNDCFIGHGVMFVNDLFSTGAPAEGKRELWKATTIGNHVSIGSNTSVLPVSICDHVVIGAGSVVTKNITKPGIYAGNPAKLIRTI
ncbi:acyltransferase [Segetibacter aerophilus]|uniref:UDP-3-O-(3-hydroxymyristoyl)glucosamine N-acyltransferase n=1 Tax=Segetibacter aerophilus TaxID=670293 RepID=A0A512BDB8_9BACT|nr:acyltransferase [Segetibacter aerophilus]GEO09948.1 UDP-3-O-(3-hydroxymyristoyl)glucosamine N-acyltransferase [Segetibacter aerophilus]